MDTYIFIFRGKEEEFCWLDYQHAKTEEEAYLKFQKQEWAENSKHFKEETEEEFIQKDPYGKDFIQTIIISGIHTPEIR